jgi:leucyl aminopeptidase
VLDLFIADDGRPAIPLYAVPSAELSTWRERLSPHEIAWLDANRFKAELGRIVILPGKDGAIGGAALGLGSDEDAFAVAQFSATLPPGDYRLVYLPKTYPPTRACFAWALGTYQFARYKPKKEKKEWPRLVLPEEADAAEATRLAEAVVLTRDLINTPSNEMGPAELEEAARSLAKRHRAAITVTTGDDLLAANYPLVHVVGRASTRKPRLIDITWGDTAHPKLTLVGKGVCFDSGGLDLKPAAAMLTMKKDMGGAAAVLGLAHLVIGSEIPVRLRVLVPAVENSVAGDAYRPGDVITSRKGLTVEIGNTDAEGRLILADALTEADGEKPSLLIDIATLTGAARTATGFELPPYFTDDEKLAMDLARHSVLEADHMWRLPLWRGYDNWIEGKVANLTNSADASYAGAITAALFLKRFVTETRSYAHFDIAAWTDRAKPGRPLGAEAQCIRALYSLIKERFGTKTP